MNPTNSQFLFFAKIFYYFDVKMGRLSFNCQNWQLGSKRETVPFLFINSIFMETKSKKGIIYYRVSTEDQAQNGVNL